MRSAYRKHVVAMLSLAGIEDPEGGADSAIALETEIATAHWDRVRSRDNSLTHNPMDLAGLAQLLPVELWNSWLDGLGAPDGVLDHVVVMQPPFLSAVSGLLTLDRLPQFKDWLTWKIVRAAAPLSSKAFVEENFDFYGRTLSGTPELRPRWKRAISMVESAGRRGARPDLRRTHFSTGSQAPHGRTGRAPAARPIGATSPS